MQKQKPCEQFGSDRSREIDALIQEATGRPCPGRTEEGSCPLDPDVYADAAQDPVPLRVVS